MKIGRNAYVKLPLKWRLRWPPKLLASLNIIFNSCFKLLLELAWRIRLIGYKIVDQQNLATTNPSIHIKFGGAFVTFVF